MEEKKELNESNANVNSEQSTFWINVAFAIWYTIVLCIEFCFPWCLFWAHLELETIKKWPEKKNESEVKSGIEWKPTKKKPKITEIHRKGR